MSATDGVYRTSVFGSSYGLLFFNDRFELMGVSQMAEEHKEAALQEWFAYLRKRLDTPKEPRCPNCEALLRVCIGCGRVDC